MHYKRNILTQFNLFLQNKKFQNKTLLEVGLRRILCLDLKSNTNQNLEPIVTNTKNKETNK